PLAPYGFSSAARLSWTSPRAPTSDRSAAVYVEVGATMWRARVVKTLPIAAERVVSRIRKRGTARGRDHPRYRLTVSQPGSRARRPHWSEGSSSTRRQRPRHALHPEASPAARGPQPWRQVADARRCSARHGSGPTGRRTFAPWRRRHAMRGVFRVEHAGDGLRGGARARRWWSRVVVERGGDRAPRRRRVLRPSRRTARDRG